MKTVEIIGYNRANLGKTESKRLRAEGQVPSVLYGSGEQVHFSSPMILFRDVVYTDQATFVELNIEGKKFSAILQDVQFHPVSEVILHADFLQLSEDKPVKMDIPIQTKGDAPGVKAGGKLLKKLRYITVKALPKNMPEVIEVDITGLDLGKTIKVGELTSGDYEILNSPLVSILGIEIPRALRGKKTEEAASGKPAKGKK